MDELEHPRRGLHPIAWVGVGVLLTCTCLGGGAFLMSGLAYSRESVTRRFMDNEADWFVEAINRGEVTLDAAGYHVRSGSPSPVGVDSWGNLQRVEVEAVKPDEYVLRIVSAGEDGKHATEDDISFHAHVQRSDDVWEMTDRHIETRSPDDSG